MIAARSSSAASENAVSRSNSTIVSASRSGRRLRHGMTKRNPSSVATSSVPAPAASRTGNSPPLESEPDSDAAVESGPDDEASPLPPFVASAAWSQMHFARGASPAAVLGPARVSATSSAATKPARTRIKASASAAPG